MTKIDCCSFRWGPETIYLYVVPVTFVIVKTANTTVENIVEDKGTVRSLGSVLAPG